MSTAIAKEKKKENLDKLNWNLLPLFKQIQKAKNNFYNSCIKFQYDEKENKQILCKQLIYINKIQRNRSAFRFIIVIIV